MRATWIIIGIIGAERLTLALYSRLMRRRFLARLGSISDLVSPAACPGKLAPVFRFKNRIGQLLFGYAWYASKRDCRVPTQFLRKLIFRHIYGVNMAPGSAIYNASEIICPWNIELGKNSILGIGNIIDARGGLRIGDNVNLGHRVCIWTEQHLVNDTDFKSAVAPVTIGDRAWVSSNTTVLPGVCVGSGAVISAGAVLVKDADPFGIYSGNPAKRIGTRSFELRYELGHALPFN